MCKGYVHCAVHITTVRDNTNLEQESNDYRPQSKGDNVVGRVRPFVCVRSFG